jgi:hypothetical protein
MDYSRYFVRVPKGKHTNDFQYDGPDDLPEWREWLTSMLFRNAFFLRDNMVDQSDDKVSFINNFLDYHYSQYVGEFDQFATCIRSVQENVKKFLKGKTPPPALEYWEPLFTLYTPIIDKWITRTATRPRKPREVTLNDLFNRELAAYFYYMGEEPTSRNIAELLEKYHIDKERKKPTDIVEEYGLWESAINRRAQDSKPKARASIKKLYDRVGKLLTGEPLQTLKSDYQIFIEAGKKPE